MNPLIVFATSHHGQRAPLNQIPADLRGSFSNDRSRLQQADAVVFHVPDFTYKEFGDTPKYPGQVWVAWSMESNVNYPLQADPAFLRHFDLTIGYERTADIWAPYLPALDAWQQAQLLPRAARQSAVPAVMFQSDPLNRSGRVGFAAELMKHIRIDSYGKVLHNRDIQEIDEGSRTKMRIISQYWFCLALENSIAPDYVTEKMFEPLMVGAVPVYLGAPNADEFAPPRSFIRVEDYDSPKALAAYLHHLIAHPDEYESYLAWRQRPLPEWILALDGCDERGRGWRELVQWLSSRTGQRRGGHYRLPFGYRAALRSRWRKHFR